MDKRNCLMCGAETEKYLQDDLQFFCSVCSKELKIGLLRYLDEISGHALNTQIFEVSCFLFGYIKPDKAICEDYEFFLKIQEKVKLEFHTSFPDRYEIASQLAN